MQLCVSLTISDKECRISNESNRGEEKPRFQEKGPGGGGTHIFFRTGTCR